MKQFLLENNYELIGTKEDGTELYVATIKGVVDNKPILVFQCIDINGTCNTPIYLELEIFNILKEMN